MSYTLNIHFIGALSVRPFVRLSVSQSVGPSIGPFRWSFRRSSRRMEASLSACQTCFFKEGCAAEMC